MTKEREEREVLYASLCIHFYETLFSYKSNLFDHSGEMLFPFHTEDCWTPRLCNLNISSIEILGHENRVTQTY